MIYVTMTDKFMSGWGTARGKINKLCIECETYEQAEIIERNASRRPEMKYINISKRLPSGSRYLLTVQSFNELGEIWKR
jgi:hypothetical protein